MATFKKRKRKVGVDAQGKPVYKDAGWQVRFVDPAGKERSKTFEKRADAKLFAARVETDKARGSYIDPDAGKATFQEYAELWRATRPWRPTTREQVESRLRLHLYPTIGDVPLRSITPTMLQGLVTERSEALAPASLALLAGYLRSIFKAAVADRLLARSPASGLALPSTEDSDPVVPLERAQWVAFAAAMPARWRAAVTLAAGSGMRMGEVLGLSVDRINFFRKEIKVDRQAITVAGSTPMFGPPKTKKSRRTIPVPQAVLDVVAAHLAEFPAGEGGLVFTMPDGSMVPRARFSAAVLAAAGKVGLGEKQRFHALRHTYASMLIRGGCSVKVVQARLGHANAQETLDTYAHMWPDDDDRTRDAVSEGFAEQSDPDRTEDTQQGT